jgi:hypothetical protein
MPALGQDVGEELAALEAQGGEITVTGPLGPLLRLQTGLMTAVKWTSFVVAIGMSGLAVPIIETLANLAQRATSWIPFFGRSIAAGIGHGVQWLTSRLGGQYQKIETEVGRGLTELNTELKLLGADVLAAGFTMARLAQALVALSRKPSLAPQIQRIQKTVRPLPAHITEVHKRVTYIIRTSPKAVPVHLTQQIHHLDAQVKHQQTEIARLQEQVKARPHPSTLAQAVPVVALGLAGLGLNASRCEGPREFNKALCEAGPQGLGNLLGLLGGAALFLGLIELAEAEQGFVSGVAGVVHDYWL